MSRQWVYANNAMASIYIPAARTGACAKPVPAKDIPLHLCVCCDVMRSRIDAT